MHSILCPFLPYVLQVRSSPGRGVGVKTFYRTPHEPSREVDRFPTRFKQTVLQIVHLIVWTHPLSVEIVVSVQLLCTGSYTEGVVVLLTPKGSTSVDVCVNGW